MKATLAALGVTALAAILYPAPDAAGAATSAVTGDAEAASGIEGAAPEAAPKAATPTVLASARPARVAVGEVFTVVISARGLRDAGAVAFHLVYDPARIAPVPDGFREGPLLARGGPGTSFLARPMSAGDRLAVGLTRLGASRGARGSGTLCRLTFRALKAGPATLSFDRAHVTDPEAREQRARFTGARVVVAERPEVRPPSGGAP